MRRGGARGPHPQDGRTRANEKRPGGRRSCDHRSTSPACLAARRHPLGPGGRGPPRGRVGRSRPPRSLGRPGRRVLHRVPEPAPRVGLLRRPRPGRAARARARPREAVRHHAVPPPRRAVPGRPRGDGLRPGEGPHRPQGGEERPPRARRRELRRQGDLVAHRWGEGEGRPAVGVRRRGLVAADLRSAPRRPHFLVGLPLRRAEAHRLQGGRVHRVPAVAPGHQRAAGRAVPHVTGDAGLCARGKAELVTSLGLWYVCQTTTDRRGEIVAVEQRYFVTSIPTGTLTRDQELALVRMHWAIENGCHWTMDVMLGEDEGHPCQASRASIETVSWLRLIGYNAVSAWRTLAPRKDGKPVAWARAMETLRDALLAAEVTDHRELASAVT